MFGWQTDSPVPASDTRKCFRFGHTHTPTHLPCLVEFVRSEFVPYFIPSVSLPVHTFFVAVCGHFYFSFLWTPWYKTHTHTHLFSVRETPNHEEGCKKKIVKYNKSSQLNVPGTLVLFQGHFYLLSLLARFLFLAVGRVFFSGGFSYAFRSAFGASFFFWFFSVW